MNLKADALTIMVILFGVGTAATATMQVVFA